jgi:Ca2+/H+ antiporter
MASGDTTFNGGFWESSIAFFSHNEASPYLNFLLLAFLPTLILYGARDQHVSQFSFSLLSIAIFDDRVEFLLNQSRFALPPLLDIIVHTLFSNITPLLLGIFFLSNGYTDSLSLYLIGYFFTGVLFTLGTVFFVAGLHHEVLRYYSKGINYQILLLSVGIALYVLPVVQYNADEMYSSVEYDWSTVQSFFLLFMHSCYVVFKVRCRSFFSFFLRVFVVITLIFRMGVDWHSQPAVRVVDRRSSWSGYRCRWKHS